MSLFTAPLTPSVPHKVWGEPRLFNLMVYYMRRFYGNGGDFPPPSVTDVERCLSMVREEKSLVTSAELEVLFRSARTWQLFEYSTPDSPGLIQHYLELAREYCADNCIFDHYYGLLCVQLITSLILAGIINEQEERESIFEYLRSENDPEIPLLCQVTAYATTLLSAALIQDHRGNNNLVGEFFGEKESEHVLLSRIGGFYQQDALWLLNELWTSRRSFLYLCGGLSKDLPGWSALFTAIWTHIKKVKNPITLIKRLRNLLLRFSLAAVDPEFDLVCNLIAELDDHIPLTGPDDRELPPVDQQDANFMVTLFLGIFNSEKPVRAQSELICYPFGLVYHNALVAQPESAPSLLVAAIERVWKKLGDPGSGMTLRERILDSFEYAIRATVSMSIALISGGERSKKVTVIVWTKLLRDANILELVGRLCSIVVISTNGLGNGLLISQEQFKQFVDCIRQLLGGLKNIVQVHKLGDLDDLRHTWNKVHRYIDLQLSVYPPTGPVQNRIRICQSVWLDVGEAFKFKPQATYQQHRCMSPRCPDPFPDGGAQRICMRCCWVHYCSRRCQSTHWDCGLELAHRNECIVLDIRH